MGRLLAFGERGLLVPSHILDHILPAVYWGDDLQ